MFQWISYSWHYMRLIVSVFNYYQKYLRGDIQLNEFVDQLIPKISACGSVAIKFCQWLVPKMELMYINEELFFDPEYEKPRWVKKLEVFLEDCPEHDVSYSLKHYREIFREEITDQYTIKDTLGSGSIGQVYLIENKKTSMQYVMKIQHPDINSQISFFYYFYWLISRIPILKTMSRKIPFNLYDFIQSFTEQCDFIHEANNLLRMKDTYKDNDYILIPEVIKVSRTILIMEYLKGDSFDRADISEYKLGKVFTLFYIFTRNNILIENFNHGDLHQGNWKVTDDGRLIVYDFGFCWSIPKDKESLIELALNTFEGTSPTDVEVIIKNISELMYMLLNHDGVVDKENLRRDIRDHVTDSDFVGKSGNGVVASPITTIKLMNIFCQQRENITINSHLIQFLILFIQIQRNCIRYGYASFQGDTYPLSKIYKDRYMDCLNICKTYNIFPGYTRYIEEKLNGIQLERTTIFDTILIPESLREFAIQ